jgi:hypothetical protein
VGVGRCYLGGDGGQWVRLRLRGRGVPLDRGVRGNGLLIVLLLGVEIGRIPGLFYEMPRMQIPQCTLNSQTRLKAAEKALSRPRGSSINVPIPSTTPSIPSSCSPTSSPFPPSVPPSAALARSWFAARSGRRDCASFFNCATSLVLIQGSNRLAIICSHRNCSSEA